MRNALRLRLDVVLDCSAAAGKLALVQDVDALTQRRKTFQQVLRKVVLHMQNPARQRPCARERRGCPLTHRLLGSQHELVLLKSQSGGALLRIFLQCPADKGGSARRCATRLSRQQARACRHRATRSLKWREKWRDPESASSCARRPHDVSATRQLECSVSPTHRRGRVLQRHHQHFHGRILGERRMAVCEL